MYVSDLTKNNRILNWICLGASHPCASGGTCTDFLNSYRCDCVSGFSGSNCQTNINECTSQPCANGGTCIDQTNSFTCTCIPGFSGILCETNINECTYLLHR